MTEEQFRSIFIALTGNQNGHFPWQWALYQRFAKGEFPSSCNLPTGLGKTSVIALWLIALANQPDRLPRRLVYVVNRRTVVDQTTTEVEKLRKNLGIAGLFDSLKQLCAILPEADDPPLAVSTLRGQFADNREWSGDPARPAVIAGTVDMIGSRLLFSGYGVGFKGKPLHAGFLGQDTLLIHDEAHLEPAFQALIQRIQFEQHERERVGALPWRKLQVMALTATARNDHSAGGDSFELTDAERNIPTEVPDPPTEPLHVAWRRLRAPKAIHFLAVEDEKKQLADTISDLALSDKFKDSGQAILIFAWSVENVEKIVAKLNKERLQVQQLTGTMRGLERDRLPTDQIFARFLPAANRPDGVVSVKGTAYLVCTSAGEVGVNLSADHLICDLTTFESMAQRFGRVNRFGDRANTEIHIVHPKEFDEEDAYEERRKRTLELLQQLHGDASPAALSKLDPAARQAAFAPPPTLLPATDILFDSWALTTVHGELPGRPPVEPYLHGISEWQPPETYLAWREEVGLITGELLERYEPEDLLEDYPLKPHELLRDASSRVFDRLKKLEAAAATPVWIISPDGPVKVTTLEQVREGGKEELSYKILLLPPSAGGLKGGFLSADSTTADDVADSWFADKDKTIPRRQRFRSDQPRPESHKGMRLVREIDLNPADEEEEIPEKLGTEASVEGEAPAGGRYWRWYVRPRSADDDLSKTAEAPVRWKDHTDQVTGNVKAIADKLNLPSELREALELAGRFHDLGKKRELWQQTIGNPNPADWHAKSGKHWKPLDLSDYRHEFGSLLDVQDEPEFQCLDDGVKDLVSHLIAAHHGRGRPHFPQAEVLDPGPKGKAAAAIAAEVPRRYGRLQRRYGRWGLAYLESLLRAADYAASARPGDLHEGAR